MNFSNSNNGQDAGVGETKDVLICTLNEHQGQHGHWPISVLGLEDLTNVCRICASSSTAHQVCPIFDGQGQCDDLAEKINKYLPIKVSKDDSLPQGICEQCRSTLIAWDELVKCSVQAEIMLQQKLTVMRLLYPDKSKQEETPGLLKKTESPCDSFEDCFLDHEDDHHYDTDKETWPRNTSTEVLSDDDDKPLAAIAKTKSNLYQDFYTALMNFRNHFVTNHDDEMAYSDFSDSSDSDKNEDTERVDLHSFDDLTDCNMRKDKMDEQTKTELSQVQTKINGKMYYTCRVCGKQLSSTHSYIFHKRIHTGERPCVCHICGKQFRTPGGLQRHVTETHEKQRYYTCMVCFKNFANSQNLKQHMRIHTGERPFVCPHCGKRFTQSGTLHVHLKTHSDSFPHVCTECGAKFRIRSSLTRHRLKHTGQRPHECVDCGKGFRHKHELNSHVLVHTDSSPHVCAVCGSAFKQRRALRHHCKRLHQNEVSDVTQVSHVYNHVGQYEGYKQLLCVKAENDTSPEVIQSDHRKPQKMLTKDGKKYAACHICQKNIAIASWRRHSQSHMTVKRYSCHICGLGFNDSGNLARHRRAVHADYRPHTCDICNKSFSRNSHLKEHINTHSENREFVCDICGKASKSGAALRMHRQIHGKEYRFSCIYCGSKFRRRGELVVHVSVHTGEKAHVCGCGKAFRLKSQLSNHTRTHVKGIEAMTDLE